MIARDRRRRANGLVAPPLSVTLLKIGRAWPRSAWLLVLVLNHNRSSGVIPLEGVPWVVPIVLALLVLVDRAARPHQVRPLHVRDRRQRRGGPAGGRQPEPDPGAGVRAAAALLAGVTGILYASFLGSISNNIAGRPVRAVLRGRSGDRRRQPVRRPGPDRRRGARRVRRGGHLQRRRSCSGSARPASTSGPPPCCSPRSPWTRWPAGAARHLAAASPARPGRPGGRGPTGLACVAGGIPGMAHWFEQITRAPGSVKLRTGGDSPRPGRGHRPADPVEFRDRR